MRLAAGEPIQALETQPIAVFPAVTDAIQKFQEYFLTWLFLAQMQARGDGQVLNAKKWQQLLSLSLSAQILSAKQMKHMQVALKTVGSQRT